eukprot:4076715-Amphidinium_carterae.1
MSSVRAPSRSRSRSFVRRGPLPRMNGRSTAPSVSPTSQRCDAGRSDVPSPIDSSGDVQQRSKRTR